MSILAAAVAQLNTYTKRYIDSLPEDTRGALNNILAARIVRRSVDEWEGSLASIAGRTIDADDRCLPVDLLDILGASTALTNLRAGGNAANDESCRSLEVAIDAAAMTAMYQLDFEAHRSGLAG